MEHQPCMASEQLQNAGAIYGFDLMQSLRSGWNNSCITGSCWKRPPVGHMPRMFGMMLTASSQNPPSEMTCAVATVPFSVMFVVVGTYTNAKESQLALVEQPPQNTTCLGLHKTALPEISSICQASSPPHCCYSVRKLVHAAAIKVSCMGALPARVHISHLKPTGPGLMVLTVIVCSCRTELESAGVKDPSTRSKQSGIGKLEGALRHCIGQAILRKPEMKVKGRCGGKQKTHQQHSQYGPAEQA